MGKQERPTRPAKAPRSRRLLFALLSVVLASGLSSAWGETAPLLDDAVKETDQSLVGAIGKTDQEQTVYRLQYLHPLFDQVEWSIGAAHSVQGELSRTDAVAGLRIFPFSMPLFVQMALGITRASSDGFRILLGAGYELDVAPSVYLEFNIGHDFIAESDAAQEEDRWTGTIGIGKRF